jgi:hypothetical protein
MPLAARFILSNIPPRLAIQGLDCCIVNVLHCKCAADHGHINLLRLGTPYGCAMLSLRTSTPTGLRSPPTTSDLNINTVITQRHVVAVNDEVCFDTMTDTPSHIHARLICQCHALSNPTWSTKTFALSNTFGKHWTRISEITTGNEIHLHNRNSTLKHILVVIFTINSILDSRIPKYHLYTKC